MDNTKDKISNIAKWMITLGTFLVGLPTLILTTVPTFPLSQTFLGIIAIAGIVLMGLGSAITSHYTGKNPNGTEKTASQIDNINNEQINTKELDVKVI